MFDILTNKINLPADTAYVTLANGDKLYSNGYIECNPAGNASFSSKEDERMHVVIDKDNLNDDKIQEYHSSFKNFEFRPQTWEQFIGQEETKQRAKYIVEQFKRGMRSHMILSAIRGHGKTSWVELLARTMDACLIQNIGNTVTLESLPNIINRINGSDKTVIWFVDEIDTCESNVLKLMNPIIESFKINGKKIKPFIFACATINKYILFKNNPDFLDRIQNHINFSRYTIDELAKIISQVYNHLYAKENVSKETIDILARNAKFNPRTAINLLETLIVEPDVTKVLSTCGIVKDGLTKTDIKILTLLSQSGRPMGANAIATKLGMCQQEYISEYESFLYEFGYILRIPSRIITDKGKEFLKNL